MSRIFTLISFIALMITTPSLAQSFDPFEISESQKVSHYDFGIAAVSRDPYVGAGQKDITILPYANIKHKGRYFVNPALGAGVYLRNTETLRLAAGANLSLGRDGNDTPFNNDVFDIDPSITTNVALRYYLPIAALDVVGTLPITGDLEGARADVLLSTEFRPIPQLRITPGIRATYQSGDWLDTIYGVNATQSAATTLPQLGHSGQISVFGLHSAAYLSLSDHYEIVGVVNYSKLLGDIKDSPLTPSNSGVTAAIAIARKF